MWKLPRAILSTMRRRPVRSGIILAVLAGASYAGWGQASAWHSYLDAGRAEKRGDFAAAWDALQPCLAAWPSSASTQLLAARLARRAGRLQDAQAGLARAQQLGAPAEDIILERYLLRAMSGELAEVEPKLRAFLDKEHPHSVGILESLTQQCMNDYRLEEARALLERWRSLDPKDREPLRRLGWIDERLGNNAAAIVHYQLALTLRPEADDAVDPGGRDDDAVRLRLTELLLDQSQPRDAEPHLLKLRARQPDNLAVALAYIRYLGLVGQSQKAAELLDQLMRGRPPEARLLLERARLHMGMGQPERAEPLLRDAVKLSPHDRQIVYLFGQCLKIQSKNEAQVYETRLKEIRADEKKMRELMQELLRSPKDAWLHYQIGRLFLRNGFERDGERFLLTTVRYDPDNRLAHQALAAHYEQAGQPELAALHRRAGAKAAP